MKVLFLDIDGVLNNHMHLANGYNCLERHKVMLLCDAVMRRCPDVVIAISSAWRYLTLNNDISHRGFEYIFMIHGAPYDSIHGRIIAHTESDNATCIRLGLMDRDAELDYEWLKENGCDIRCEQIDALVQHLKPSRYAVLDDLPLSCPNLFQTNGDEGLTWGLARAVTRYFLEEPA